MKIELKPIHSKAEHKAMLGEIQRLWSAKPKTRDGDRLEVVMTLVEAYERERFKIDLPDPIAAIEFRMEQAGLKRADLERVIGSRGRVAEVLNRKRGLSIEMIRRLNAEMDIPAQVLIQPTVTERSGRVKAFTAPRVGTSVLMGQEGGVRVAASRKPSRPIRKK
jgi:HTH-type transcriptional regulator/antitoxin HigA